MGHPVELECARGTDPHHKNFPRAKNEDFQRGRKCEADFRYTNFFWPRTHPPTHPPTGNGGGGGFSFSNGLCPTRVSQEDAPDALTVLRYVLSPNFCLSDVKRVSPSKHAFGHRSSSSRCPLHFCGGSTAPLPPTPQMNVSVAHADGLIGVSFRARRPPRCSDGPGPTYCPRAARASRRHPLGRRLCRCAGQPGKLHNGPCVHRYQLGEATVPGACHDGGPIGGGPIRGGLLGGPLGGPLGGLLRGVLGGLLVCCLWTLLQVDAVCHW